MWDVGGQDQVPRARTSPFYVALTACQIRGLWRHYFLNTQAVIFVVDSNDGSRLKVRRLDQHNFQNDNAHPCAGGARRALEDSRVGGAEGCCDFGSGEQAGSAKRAVSTSRSSSMSLMRPARSGTRTMWRLRWTSKRSRRTHGTCRAPAPRRRSAWTRASTGWRIASRTRSEHCPLPLFPLPPPPPLATLVSSVQPQPRPAGSFFVSKPRRRPQAGAACNVFELALYGATGWLSDSAGPGAAPLTCAAGPGGRRGGAPRRCWRGRP